MTMEEFKIEHFEKEYPDTKFPWFEVLNDQEIIELRNGLYSRLSIERLSDDKILVQRINNAVILIENVNASRIGFSLLGLLKSKGIESSDVVYVNWYRFDDVDRFKLEDLSEYFDDIWYPGSDDIDIFDGSLSWVISVSHSGEIKMGILK